MLDVRCLKILDALKGAERLSSQQLCELLRVSDKTCRNAVHQLSSALAGISNPSGASIKVVRGKGYQLVVADPAAFAAWEQRMVLQNEALPQSPAERSRYVVHRLLYAGERGVKRQVLCEELYVSEKTISADLRVAETMLSAFCLTLRRTKTGIAVEGTEQQKRQCLLSVSYNVYQSWFKQNARDVSLGRHISAVVQHESDRAFSEYGIQTIVDYLIVAKHRMDRGFYCTASLHTNDDGDCLLAQRIFAALVEDGTVSAITDDEVCELQVFIDSSLTMELNTKARGVSVVPPYIQALTKDILDSIQERYGTRFYQSDLFIGGLQSHVMSIDRRVRYGIRLNAVVYRELRQRYVLAYMLAQQASAVLGEFYGQPIPEVETEFLTMLLEVFRDTSAQQPVLPRVLLVLPQDTLSSVYLFFLLAKEFRHKIAHVYVCDARRAETYDLSSVDIIISVVEFRRDVPIPVWRIGDVMSPSVRDEIVARLRQHEIDQIKEYIRPELFFTGINAYDFESAIIALCSRAGRVIDLPPRFAESVLYRETMGSSDLGYLSALPHPARSLSEDALCVIGVLDHPIPWVHQDVQLIILTAFPQAPEKGADSLLLRFVRLISDPDCVMGILRERTFKALIDGLVGAWRHS